MQYVVAVPHDPSQWACEREGPYLGHACVVAQKRQVAQGFEPEWRRFLASHSSCDGLAHISALVFGSLRCGRYRLVGGRVVCPGHVTHYVDFMMAGQAAP
jgi:hypothetical protein